MRCGPRPILFLTLLTLLFAVQSFAEEPATDKRKVPELRATRINPAKPIVDGDLNDGIWNRPGLDFARNFLQMEPDEGEPATESTTVAVIYDDDAVYFAFWNYDSEPEKIIRQLVRRDRWAESDMITVRLDPYHDHQTGYRFEISAAGVLRDFRMFGDTFLDDSWDGVWEAAVKEQPWGWSAEIRIPYHCLRFTEKDEHVWGCNVTRYVSRKSESSWWAFSPSTEGGSVSRFGHLTGISGIKPARHLEILPYVVSSTELDPKSAGNPDGKDFFGNTGFDIKYGLSSNLILDATINPDFGQVELDYPVLNLSSFETYYSERRPFFVEGSNMFATEFGLFYSRRIGRSPGGVDDNDFNYYTDRPKAVTILGAAKITGKLPGGTSIALLNAATSEETAAYDAQVMNQDTVWAGSTYTIDTTYSTVHREAVVEEKANYSVLRLQQDLFSNSSVGGMLTLASQNSINPATTGGVDWRLTTQNGVWNFSGQSVFSRIGDGKTGFGMTTEIYKAAGKHIRGSMGVTIKDPYLDLNRIGYLSRNDERKTWLWVQYRTQDDWWFVRNSYNNFNMYAGWNYAGANIQKGWNFNTYIEFTNKWSLGCGFNHNIYKYCDRETRGNGLWEIPNSWSWWASLNTDESKKVSLNINPGSGVNRFAKWWANYIGLEYRPRSNMEFTAGMNYVQDIGEVRWVENRGDTAVFAALHQDQITPRFSASIMPHRNLSIQLSAQGMISGLDYRKPRRYLGGFDYEYMPDISEDNYDYNYSALNSTLILRWEYLPGSTLYLVWTRSRGEVDDCVHDLDIDRDIKRLFSSGANNVWLVKASYWWNI